MKDIPLSTLDPDRVELLRRKLGALLKWSVPAVCRTIGPFDLTPFEGYATELGIIIQKCIDRTDAFTRTEIAALLGKSGMASASLAAGWHSYLLTEIEAMMGAEPIWLAGGFGHPDHVADFAHWAMMPRFSVAELTCLTIGINPCEFSKDQLDRMTKATNRSEFLPTVEFLLQRYELLQRTFDHVQQDCHVQPAKFIAWANMVELTVHSGFLEPLKRYHAVRPAPSGPVAPRKVDKREIDSIAQLFTALAIDAYGYRPRQTRSPIPTEIANVAAGMGMTITDDTIRKYLKLGTTFIPTGWMPTK